MGILAEQKDKDVEALTWVAQHSFQAWEEHKRGRGRSDGYEIQLNEDLVPALSDLGTKIHHRRFPEPTTVDRVSTLVVVANCFPFFTLSHNGRVVTSIRDRRYVFARLTCAFVCAGLCLYRTTSDAGTQGFQRFKGFRDPHKAKRFHALLELLDSAEIKSSSKASNDSEERTFRTFARDILSVANFLEDEISFQVGDPDGEALQIGFEQENAD